MNTLIENLNALVTIKKELNKVLVDNGQPGGQVFDTYPEQFRELFRVAEGRLDDIEEGPYSDYEIETTVARPVIEFENNVITLTCSTVGAEIHFRTKDIYGNIKGDTNYVNRFSISRDTWIETYAILNGVRSSEPDNSRWCYYQQGSAVIAPQIHRIDGMVLITCEQENAIIWYRILPSSNFTQYTEPISVNDRKTIEAYSVYLGKGSETVVSEGIIVAPAEPVITCLQNIVTITCETEDAVIYYHTNLDSEWREYTSPIEISVDTVFTAKAYIDELYSQEVTYTAEYEEPYVPPVIADPVFSINRNEVTITCSTSGAVIYYHVVGNPNWILYDGPITISQDTDFEAYSLFEGQSSNLVSYSAEYSNPPANPVFSIFENEVSIICSTVGATIYYRIGNSGEFSVYTNPILIEENTVFEAYSEKDGLQSNTVIYNATYVEIDYSFKYLTFKNTHLGARIIFRQNNSSLPTISIQYSKDNGSTWSTIHSYYSGEAEEITVSSREKVLFKGLNTCYDGYWIQFIASTGTYEIEGNIMSLIYGDNFINKLSLPSNATFKGIFRKGNNQSAMLKSALNLVLPATTLTESCYREMFYEQDNLINAPKILPAPNLANYCYQEMFYGCTKLINPPQLPATTLAQHCYNNMFALCTSLEVAPDLPAVNIVGNTGCYNYMYYNCTKLKYIKCLATNVSSGYYTLDWVYGVRSYPSLEGPGTFVKNPSGIWTNGSNGIPSSWTVQNAT